MTDRDTFAAAALTGLISEGDDGSFSEESYARAAYRWADVMLRERGVTEPMPQEKRAEVSYRLTDEERETLREMMDEAALYADEIGLSTTEIRERQATLRKLLERLA